MSDQPFSPDFIEGFVKRCAAKGMGERETADHFKVYAWNAICMDPDIQRGFRERIKTANIRPSIMTKMLTPERIAMAAEMTLMHSKTAAATWTRNYLDQHGLLMKTAMTQRPPQGPGVADLFRTFQAIPLEDRLIVAAILGAGGGGLARGLRPSQDDQVENRGVFGRVMRGAGRGASTMTGAAAGASAGAGIGDAFSPEVRLPLSAFGAVLGGMAGHRLAGDVIR